MEQITPERRRFRVERHIFSVNLPLNGVTFFRLAVVAAVIGFAAINIWTRMLAQHAAPPPSAFASFEDVSPGQPRSAIEARGFSCQWHSYTNTVKENCTLELANGVFTQVEVAMLNDVVASTTFMFRDNAFRLGDFEAFLGSPSVHRYGRVLNYSWPERGVIALAFPSDEQAPLFLPLWSVSFSGKSLLG